MHLRHDNGHLRRGLSFIALVAVLGLSAVGLTQCRIVDATGVDVRDNEVFHGRGRSACVHRCKDNYKKCKRQEEERHCNAERVCDRIRNNSDRKACYRKEQEKHEDARKECRRQKEMCKKNCNYREGSGGGGR